MTTFLARRLMQAVLVLVGSKAQMGDAFLQLQNRKRFELRVERHHRSALVFSIPHGHLA